MSYIVGYSVKYKYDPDLAVGHIEQLKELSDVDALYSTLKANHGKNLVSFKVYEFLEERI